MLKMDVMASRMCKLLILISSFQKLQNDPFDESVQSFTLQDLEGLWESESDEDAWESESDEDAQQESSISDIQDDDLDSLSSVPEETSRDPCTSNIDVPMQHLRSTSNVLNASDSSTAICDNFITEQWYRSSAGYDLVKHCPAFLQCHTYYQLWLNGELPTVSEGEAIRTVCMNGLTGCCETSLYIKVKNCGSYYVYYLRRPSGCPIAYCFEASLTNTVTTDGSIPDSTQIGRSFESTTVPDMSITPSDTEPSNMATQETSSGVPTNTDPANCFASMFYYADFHFSRKQIRKQHGSESDNLWPLYLILLLLLPIGLPVAIFVLPRRIRGWRILRLSNFPASREANVETNEDLNLSQIGRGDSTCTNSVAIDTAIADRTITDTAQIEREISDTTPKEREISDTTPRIIPAGKRRKNRIRGNRARSEH